MTGADWQMLEVRLVRRPGAGEAERSGETPVADQQLGHMLPLPTGKKWRKMQNRISNLL